jgi:hypothetical protein
MANPFFHVIISYRVSTENNLARKMFDRLIFNSYNRIPATDNNPWPDEFCSDHQREGHARVFLDQVCLKAGETWGAGGGYVGALMKSFVFVPLLSWNVEIDSNESVLHDFRKKRFAGSVGDMVARFCGALPSQFIDPDPCQRAFIDGVDSVLLQLILAMELHAHMMRVNAGASCFHPCKRLFPIVVGHPPDVRQLPDEVSELTYAEARMHLQRAGVHVPVPGRKLTVRGVIQFFIGIQVEVLADHGEHDVAVDAVCNNIVSAVCDEVSKVDPQNHHDQLPAPQPQLLPPQLSSILLQIAAPPHSFLAFAADDCDDGDIPSLALMRPAKLQSKYKLSHQQALDFVTLCSATVVPPPAQPAVLLPVLCDVPPLFQGDLDSIQAVCAQPSRARTLSPQRTIAPHLPVDHRPLLDALHLKIMKRLVSGLVWFVCWV